MEEDEEKKKEEENKFKAFQGKGYTFEDSKPQQQTGPMDEELKQAMELSMNEYVIDLERRIPKEPAENDPNAYNINFRYEGNVFIRRFNAGDLIRVNIPYII